MATYTTNYNLKKPDSSDPFGDFRGDYNDNLDIIDANLGGGGGSGGHTIVDPDGNSLPQEDELQFTGAVSVTDDNVNGRTVVNVSGGSNLILDAQIYTTEEKQVGVWRDKKPLYQKTIVLNNEITVSNTAWTSTGVTASSLDVETYVRCVAQNSGGTCWDAVNVATIGGYVSLTAWRNGDTIGVKEFTIQYTKTSDVAGSGGYEAYGFSPVIYSDVERVIGVWRDNKPLYQKTIHIGSLTFDTNWHNVPHGITNIDKVISCEGIMFGDDGSYKEFYPLPNYRSNTNQGIVWGIQGTSSEYVSYINNWYSATNDAYATLRYTKTTDVAGSGDYNTYGVPTVHYSTSEQVIGTYLGKPLYQKTLILRENGVDLYTYSGNSYLNCLPNDIEFINIVQMFMPRSGGDAGYVDVRNNYNEVQVVPNISNQSIYLYDSHSPTDITLTIEFTKTTD